MTDITVQSISDRATWLAFRADWRARYAQASEDVRAVKRAMRALVADRRSGAVAADVVDGRMSDRQMEREDRRVDARDLMHLLDLGRKRRDALLAARDEARSAGTAAEQLAA